MLRSQVDAMPAAEYQDWIKYYNAEPFGFPRNNQMFGELMTAILSASSKEFKKEDLKPSRWMYKTTAGAADEMSADDIAALAESIKNTFPSGRRSIRRRPRNKRNRS